MAHFLSLRYIDGPFVIIGTSMGLKFSINGTAIVDISSLELVQIAQTLQNETSMTDRVLRGKVFGTPTPNCPVIFCPDSDRTEK